MIYKIKIINLRIKKYETAYRESYQNWVALRKFVSSIYKLCVSVESQPANGTFGFADTQTNAQKTKRAIFAITNYC